MVLFVLSGQSRAPRATVPRDADTPMDSGVQGAVILDVHRSTTAVTWLKAMTMAHMPAYNRIASFVLDVLPKGRAPLLSLRLFDRTCVKVVHVPVVGWPKKRKRTNQPRGRSIGVSRAVRCTEATKSPKVRAGESLGKRPISPTFPSSLSGCTAPQLACCDDHLTLCLVVNAQTCSGH